MKNNIVVWLIIGCVVMLIPSCLGGGDETDVTAYKDAQIASLTLSHDSVTVLSSVKFTIDQVNGLIYNRDSLPYGTQISTVICALTYNSGVRLTLVAQEASGDSIWWNGTDSLDFSQPVRFVTTAYDGLTTKSYVAHVNIHQIVPDSMVWERQASPMLGWKADELKVIHALYEGADGYLLYAKSTTANRLYFSPDAGQWTELSLSGLPLSTTLSQITAFEGALYAAADGAVYRSDDGLLWTAVESAPAVQAIMGVVRVGRNTPARLSTLAGDGNDSFFAAMTPDGAWTDGEASPDNFPTLGFGSLSHYRMNYEYLTIVGGQNKDNNLLNATWSTTDGLAWALLTNESDTYLEKKSGLMLTIYDDKFYLTGGINAEGQASKEVHLSIDNGASWRRADSLVIFPEEYAGRGHASILTDENNYMLIFGGKTDKDAKHADELWRGRINRLIK